MSYWFIAKFILKSPKYFSETFQNGNKSNTGWNDKIVVQRKQYYSFILKLLLKKSI